MIEDAALQRVGETLCLTPQPAPSIFVQLVLPTLFVLRPRVPGLTLPW